MTALEISAAYIVDLILGDPRGYPHPVKLIGRVISFFEKKFLQWAGSPWKQRFLGGVLAVMIVSGAGIFTWGIIRIAGWVHPILSFVITIFFAYTTLATRNLYDEVKRVIHTLEQGNVVHARKEMGYLVSRDTEHLNEEGICRALIETVSENTSDGIVAPLFYLAIGGVPLAMAYKALNTLDSMVGYKNERYQYFGWASARADDLANFIPARMTAFLFVVCSFILGKNWKNSGRMAWRDGHKHLSPNSGYPEAAVAGALDVQLGGKNIYFGIPQEKPLIGEPKNPIHLKTVNNSLHLMIGVSLIAVIITVLIILWG
jgi:adenosylcobinamide-phosphate synthase